MASEPVTPLDKLEEVAKILDSYAAHPFEAGPGCFRSDAADIRRYIANARTTAPPAPRGWTDWTTEAPEVAGFYWRRLVTEDATSDARVEFVNEHQARDYRHHQMLREMVGDPLQEQFAGPIPSPGTSAPQVSESARALVASQACDDGLWFEAQTAPEAYLQQELRRLHSAVESGTSAPSREDVLREAATACDEVGDERHRMLDSIAPDSNHARDVLGAIVGAGRCRAAILALINKEPAR